MAVSAIQAAQTYASPQNAPSSLTVAAALVALRESPSARLSISDSADAITRNFDALARVAGNITAIEVTDGGDEPPGVVTVSAAQYLKQSSRLLARFTGDFGFAVQGLAATRAATAQADARIARFTVTDNSGEIGARLSGLQGLNKLQGISVSTPETLISLTATQIDDLGDVLAKITTGSHGLAVTEATAAQAVGLAADTRVRSVRVLDSATHIAERLDGLMALGARLKGLRSADANVITVSAEQFQRNALVLGKLYRGHDLAILGASVSQLAPMASNRRVIAIEVEDTAANVAANLTRLARLGSDLRSIRLTDAATPLALSSREYATHGSGVLAKIEDDYSVGILRAGVQEAQTLQNDDRVVSIDVLDSARAVSLGLDDLGELGKLNRVALAGKSRSIELSAQQLAQTQVLDKVSGQYTLAVQGVAADAARSLATSNARIVSVSVNDSGASVVQRLEDLSFLGRRLASIQLSDPTTALDLSVSGWTTHIGTLAKIQGGYGVALSGVSAARAVDLADDARVRTLSVSDSSAAISARLDSLHELGSVLTSINRTDAQSRLVVTGAQFATQTSTLAKVAGDLALEVRAAAAAQAASLAADDRIARVEIDDSSRNIAASLNVLQDSIAANEDRQWTIRQRGALSLLDLTATQYTRNQDALSAIAGPYVLNVREVSTEGVSDIAANHRVALISVRDSAANLADSGTLTTLTALGSRLLRIDQSDSGQAMSMTTAQWMNHRKTLDKLNGGARVVLTEASASQVQVLSQDWRVQAVSVQDTAASVGANLETLQAVGTLLSAIEVSDSAEISLTAQRYRSNAAALAKLAEGSQIAVTQASVADAQELLDEAHAAVVGVSVSDTASNLGSSLAALASNAKLRAITVSDPNSLLAITKESLDDQSAVVGMIQGPVRLAVTQAASSDVAALAANVRVASISVHDTTQAVAANLPALTAAGRRLERITFEGATELGVTATQWTAHQATLAKIAQSHSVIVSGATAAQAAAIATVPGVSGVTVSDTGAQVARHLESLQSAGPALSAITLTDAQTPTLRISAAQMSANAAALGKIAEGNYRLSVTGATVAEALALAGHAKVTAVSVSDASSRIASNLGALAGLATLSSITQTGSVSTMSLTASDYVAHASTLGKLTNAYTVALAGASVASASSLQADTKVSAMTVSATTSQISGSMATLAGLSKLTGLSVTQDDGVVSVTQAGLSTYADLLDLLRNANGNPYRLQVTGVTPDQLASVAARADLHSLTLTATSAQLGESLDELFSLGDKLAAITLTDAAVPVPLTHGQLLSRAAVLAKVAGTPEWSVTAVAAANAEAVAAASGVSAVSVTDSAEAISAQFDSLAALGAELLAVQVDDEGDVVVTQAQFDSASGSALIAKIMGEHDIVISG